MNRLSSYFPLIIAALLAAATFWLEQVVNNESHAGLGNNRHDPDLTAQNIVIDRFDPNGKRITRITANELKHYPDDDTADITQPILTVTRDERPTVFSSNTARAHNDTKVVVMSGNVRGQRAALANTPTTTLATEELTVMTDDEVAQTSQPVTLTHGAAVLSGVGAEWNNLTGLFTVQSMVRTTLPAKSER